MKTLLKIVLLCAIAFSALAATSCTHPNDPVGAYKITVTDDGNGTASPSVKTANEGDAVTLTATPNEGYRFRRWTSVSGGMVLSNATANPVALPMPAADVEFRAEFVDAVDPPEEYTITVKNDGNGTASANFTTAIEGDVVTLTATPNEGYRFRRWRLVSGGAILSDATANPATFPMPAANVEIRAEFIDAVDPPEEYTITVTNDGNGTASANVATAFEEESITLTATPRGGYLFDKWTVVSGGATLTDPTANPATFRMPAANVEIKAEFIEAVLYSITVTNDGNGTASASAGAAIRDEVVTLTATPGDGYLFLKWTVVSGGAVLSDPAANPATFPMPTANVEVRAEFVEAGANILDMIPDPVFRERLLTHTAPVIDKDGNGIITPEEAMTIVRINVPGATGSSGPKIESMVGIEQFPNLETLSFPYNNVTELNVSGNTKLTWLNCGFNKISSLDVRSLTLLDSFDCGNNLLTSLDVSANTRLDVFACYNNQLTSLDITKCSVLRLFYMWGCQFNLNTIKGILSDLPVRSDGDGIVQIGRNPGSASFTPADAAVAESRGWTVQN